MIKKLFWIFLLGLVLALFPSSILAQSNCPDADDETELESNDSVDEELDSDEIAWYTFEAEAGQAWRFDVSAEDELSFYFYDPEVSQNSRVRDNDEFFGLTTDDSGDTLSGLFLPTLEGLYCLQVSNETNADIAYEFTLTQLEEDRNGRLVGAEDLSFAASYNNRGHYYWGKGNYDLALESYLEAVDMDPDDAVLWGNACGAAFNLGAYEDALDYCNEALDIDSGDTYALDYRSATLGAIGEYEEAIDDYELLVELDPTNASWPLNIGFTQILLGDADEALEAMEDYADVSSDPSSLYWRGLAYVYAGEFGDAIDDFERDIDDAATPSPFDHIWLGVAYQLDGDEDSAEEAFDEAEDLAADADELLQLRQLALLAMIAGDEDEAREYYEQILALDPLAHRRRSDLLYLTILEELFDDAMYADTLEWFSAEIGID
jgi:tetratricopeptide (TPR) repeat protein